MTFTADRINGLRDDVHERGYAHLVGVGTSPDQLLEVLRYLGEPRRGTFWAELQMVTYTGSSVERSVAESDQVLSAHTDGSFEPDPPELLLLQCLQPDLPGYGESCLVTVCDIVTALPAGTTQLLREPRYRFSKQEKSKRAHATGPVLWQLGDGRDAIRYRHDQKYQIVGDREDTRAAVADLAAAVRALEGSHPAPLGAGDVLVLDNRRCLHGRSALSGRVTRQLRTAWGDYERADN
ncbi:TauD/TfdA family dioxygenase [Nocardioides zeae]|uniref:TauD/TfdA family dioxygenase n=1 Tax=Nocardioides zeae TaxID=1457234 RepID=A0A6P0HLS3_9ACTN|nr:TauD/TfdA family dioxygenase [Nocardioides zeae]